MEKIKKLNIITGIVLAGFIIAGIYHYILGNVYHLGYPFNTFLFNPRVRFSDFTYNYQIFQTLEFNPYVQHNLHVNYFPFGMITLYFFRLFPIYLSLLLYYVIVFTFFFKYCYKNIIKDLQPKYKIRAFISFIAITFLSYPFLLMFDRGHNDSFIFIFSALFIYYFMQKKYLISALICSVPIAIKGYAITYIVLLLTKKKYKEVFYCLSSASLLTIFGILIAKGGIKQNIDYILQYHVPFFKENYVIQDGSMWNSSLFGLIKMFIYLDNHCIHPIMHQVSNVPIQFKYYVISCSKNIYDVVINNALNIYTPLASLAVIAVICYIIFIEKEFWKKVTLLFIASIIFPPMASDLKLFSLYIPLFLFINAENKSKADWLYSVLFALILIPLNYLQFIPMPYDTNAFNISAVLHPVILSVLLLVIIIEGFCNYKKVQIIQNTEINCTYSET